MAAYGAMMSFLRSLDDVSPLVHFTPQIESLRDKVCFLLNSLENSLRIPCIQEIFEEGLEAKIRDAVFKAADLIEPKIIDLSVYKLKTNQLDKETYWPDDDLHEIMEEIEYLVDEVKRIEDAHGTEGQPQTAGNNFQSAAAPSSSGGSVSVGSGKKLVLGFEKDVEVIKSRLYDNSLKLKIVPIVGMGGVGKTTLARRVYDDSSFECHFDIRAWTTVSQEYVPCKVLKSLLDSRKMPVSGKLKDDGMQEEELVLNLYQSLKYRRYLIVIDDVWGNDTWDSMRRWFPDDNNGSRVLLTTRLSNVALHANPQCRLHHMSTLNGDDSWNLLCNQVFGEKDCPKELESIGKEIVANCKGLPLAIAVTGGYLSKLSSTKESWISIANDLSLVVAKDGEHCMNILSLSYKHLPHYLRPCFLYQAMYPEDTRYRVLHILCVWVAEGFLKPATKLKTPEALAEECIEDLIERNLLIACERDHRGKILTYCIHDMIWNLCMLKARKEKYLHVVKRSWDVTLQEGTGSPRRLNIRLGRRINQPQILFDIMTRGSSSVRSLIFTGEGANISFLPQIYVRHHMVFRVLELYKVRLIHFPDIITQFVNLRFLTITCNNALPSSISRLQNLETLVHYSGHWYHFLPVEIWLMPKLRHIRVTGGYLIDPLGGQIHMERFSILENLQMLKGIRNLRCQNNILKRMPDLKTLYIIYDSMPSEVWSNYQLEALANLRQLESLTLIMEKSTRASKTRLQLPAGFAFLRTLNSLTLSGCGIPWESMTIVGSLPCLEVLELCNNACQGAMWEPNVNEFGQLKYFRLRKIDDLTQWNADDTHFPRLKCLIIEYCNSLPEIPSGIGDIPTLESITVINCRSPVVASAKRIQKEQEDMGNNLKVVINNQRQREKFKISRDMRRFLQMPSS